MSLKPGLPSSTKAAICEAYSHELRFCHGDIYRQLRYHEMNGEIEEAARWKCRFSKSIRDDIDNFQRKHGRMAREFDRLLPFVGLWPGIELGAFHRWLHSKCDEAYVHYLQRMFDSWSSIFGDQEELFPLLDHNTVFHLETLAPRHATRDAGKIRELMQGGRIFSMVRHDEDRRVILEQLLATDGRILSFKTFLQDTLYLEPCAKALRRLLPSKPPGSLREAFFGSYTGVNQVPGEIRVQTRESGMVVYHGTQATSRMLGYAQLVLAVMRDFPLMTHVAPRQASGKGKPIIEGCSEEYWYQLATLAFELGFDTTEIRNLRSGNPLENLARAFIRRSRPPELYEINQHLLDNLASHFAEQFPVIAQPRYRAGPPVFTTDSEAIEKTARWNRPLDTHYLKDREYMYLDVMYNYHPITASCLTSLAFQRDIFVSFFGALPLYPVGGGVEGQDPPPPSVPPSPQLQDYSPVRVDSNPGSSIYSDRETEPHLFQPLDGDMSPSSIARMLVENGSLALYDWKEHQIARFTDGDRERFYRTVSLLADKGYCFLRLNNEGRVAVYLLRDLWDTSQGEKAILAGPKEDLANFVGRAAEILNNFTKYVLRESS
ncbi:hypothetical protein D8B26_005376 [Coccidioides posadasii str. Silveira]|nr:hypothetical protein D8B26_005376 [Coccidioides posadasii str. Silveira]